MPIDLLADDYSKPIDLLAEEPSSASFEDLSPEDQAKAMELAKQQIAINHPDMPEWMRDMILKLAPKQKSPLLESAGRAAENVSGYIPAAAGGLLQGASIPIRGVAGLIPTEFTQNLASSPDLTKLFPKAQGQGQEAIQLGSELVGGGGLFGKMMQGIKGASQLARVPGALQNPLALAGVGAIATPGDVTNRALGAGGALALGGAGKAAESILNKAGDKIPAFMRGLTNKSTPEELVKGAQKPHDRLQSTADEMYGQVRQAIKGRDIKIPMEDKFIAQAKEYFPKNKSSVNDLFDRAKKGDYEAIHKIQSSLYKKGTKQLAGDDLVKENEGEEIMDLRDRMNDFLEKNLIKGGNLDVAHVLRQGKKAHAELMNTYYAPNLRKGIGKMVNSELRLVPENPEKLFSQNSKPMKDFLAKHPEVAKHAAGITEKKEAMKALNNLLKAAGGTGGTLYAGKILSDLFK